MKLTAFLALLCYAAAALAADAGDPPGRVARVSFAQGVVSLEPSAEDQWTRVSVNDTVTTGDRILTDEKSRAELEVGPYTVQMSESTDVTVTNLDDQLLQIGVARGTVRVTVFSLADDNSVEIDTPNGALALLRTGSYRVDAFPDEGYTQALVSRGSLEVTWSGGAQAMQGGEYARLTGTGPIDVAFTPRPEADAFDNWCRDRNKRVRACISKKYVDASIPGVEDLDSAGNWTDISGYGEVWIPSAVPAGWAPYSHGHWDWVEPWGWTWADHEPWGFCPFHYGRWAHIGAAWAWVPGPRGVAPVYAPALVAFVGANGINLGIDTGKPGVQAWFALGPKEPFLPWYHSSKDYQHRVNQAGLHGVKDVAGLVDKADVARIRYANRQWGTTAVATDVFRNGQGVGPRTLKIAQQKLNAGPVIPHPDIAPTENAEYHGSVPIRAPKFASPPPPRPRMPQSPIAARRQPTLPGDASQPSLGYVQRPGTSGGRPGSVGPNIGSAPAANSVEPGSGPGVFGGPTRPAPSGPSGGSNGTVRPEVPSGGGARPGGAPAPPKPVDLIVRNPPPPADVPFTKREPALESHPGRPLEPVQKQDLREGRPAPPMKDKENPPHQDPGWSNPPAHRNIPTPPQRTAPPAQQQAPPPQRQAPPPPQRQQPPPKPPEKTNPPKK